MNSRSIRRAAERKARKLVPALEAGLFALGRIQFQDMFQEQAPELRAALIDAQTLVAFQKQFSNLRLQEFRLLRRLEKDRKELASLQSASAPNWLRVFSHPPWRTLQRAAVNFSSPSARLSSQPPAHRPCRSLKADR